MTGTLSWDWQGQAANHHDQPSHGTLPLQAVMELGATVCVPSGEPRCGDCPVAGACAALAAQQAHAAAGGDAASGPRVTDYPTKVRSEVGRRSLMLLLATRGARWRQPWSCGRAECQGTALQTHAAAQRLLPPGSDPSEAEGGTTPAH